MLVVPKPKLGVAELTCVLPKEKGVGAAPVLTAGAPKLTVLVCGVPKLPKVEPVFCEVPNNPPKNKLNQYYLLLNYLWNKHSANFKSKYSKKM